MSGNKVHVSGAAWWADYSGADAKDVGTMNLDVPSRGKTKMNEANIMTTVTQDLTAKFAQMKELRVEANGEFADKVKINGLLTLNSGMDVCTGNVNLHGSGKLLVNGSDGMEVARNQLKVNDGVKTIIGTGDVTISSGGQNGSTKMYGNAFEANATETKMFTKSLVVTDNSMSSTVATATIATGNANQQMKLNGNELHLQHSEKIRLESKVTEFQGIGTSAVSYTHLTLPTICSV